MSELKARMLGQTMNEYGCDTKIYLKSEADSEIRKQKHKRCLAMAKWCDSEMNYWYDRIEMEQCPRFKFYEKWHKRWLAIAEKFKPNN